MWKVWQELLNIKLLENTWEDSHWREAILVPKVKSATRASHNQVTWRNMRRFIQDRSHPRALSVTRQELLSFKCTEDTCEDTHRRDANSSAQGVKRSSQFQVTWRSLRALVQERSHLSAWSATAASQFYVTRRDIKENTQESSHYSVRNVSRTSHKQVTRRNMRELTQERSHSSAPSVTRTFRN